MWDAERHLLPNAAALIIIISTYELGVAILAEAGLTYLGLGAQEPTPSWELMLSPSVSAEILKAPWVVIAPGVAITLIVFSYILEVEVPELTLDKSKTAVLVMDVQNEIVARNAQARERNIVPKIKGVLQAARAAGVTVVHVVVMFRDGYPEIAPHNKHWVYLRDGGRVREGTPGVGIPDEIAPLPGELIVVKRRGSAFFGTDLEILLRQRGITTLVMMGIATGGVVLWTALYSADADYENVVLEDCCSDTTPESHAFLCDIIGRRATIATSRDFIRAMVKK